MASPDVAEDPPPAPAEEALPEGDLLTLWNNNELSFTQRNSLLKRIEEEGLLPRISTAMDTWEREGGLYPDTEDPRFIEKLLAKREFAETKQDSIAQQVADGVNPCDPDREFELTPVQRFVGRFLSPQCPYQSALLYHGVGVGKTCAAITIAENYLRAYPRKQVFIVAPRNIQPGFRRTIFDDEALVIPEEDGLPNTAKGCTGNSYLKRTGMEFERDLSTIKRHVKQSIDARYHFLGYIQFHHHIEDLLKIIPKSLDKDSYAAQRERILRREFSGRLVIIDEAHNLRDNPSETVEDSADNPGGDTEMTESQAGKRLTPALERILDSAEGMKLVLLSGTPMYNSYKEIVFLMNLLLRNDKRALLSERDIFTPQGGFRPAVEGHRSGEELLGGVAAAYVSFMRGENPLSFPARLPPLGTPTLTSWPPMAPNTTTIPAEEGARMLKMPFVPVKYEAAALDAYLQVSEDVITAGGMGINSIDEMVQAGNWLFPGEGGAQIRDAGFDTCFEDSAAGGSGQSQFTERRGDAKWLLRENLGAVSAKAKFVLERAQTARGPVFVYSRFIKSGAIPLALALEANGYTPWGDRRPLLGNGIQDGLGRQCALCARREKQHAGATHRFTAAKYILITGRASVSPNNPVAIQAARARENMDGGQVKVIIGSQVASEGVDFRFIREIYVFDSWFHLNKMEQVLGRGIRTCSHSMLPKDQRNCTIHLLVNTFGEGQDTETADLYMYRAAMGKAIQTGHVTRVLKRYALDCNLNREAILVTGLATERHVDAQGVVREEVNINDTPFTNLCDWIDTCDYTCATPLDISVDGNDLATYDEFAVRWRESELKGVIRKLFQTREQPVFQLEEILEMMSAVPPRAIQGLLAEIVGNQSFRLRVGRTDGYIIYRNGYYLFQPDYLSDIRAPLSLRVAEVPVKRDAFEPTAMKVAPVLAVTPTPTAPAITPAEGAEEAPPAAKEIVASSLTQFWGAIQGWAVEIAAGDAIRENIPPMCCEAIDARYVGDERVREKERLIMVNWLYDHILSSPVYTGEQKRSYLNSLSTTLLEFVWDESLRPNEQQALLRGGDESAQQVAREQVLKRGTTNAFRYVDASTGVINYVCDGKACSDAVARVLDMDRTDPLNQLKVDITTTGGIYGFLVPKAKEGVLVFKTSDKPPVVGGKVEKGSECAIVSTISFHIRMLKEIAENLVKEGFPKFILIEDVLDEKTRKKGAAGAAEAGATVATAANVKICGSRETTAKLTRTFQNSSRACALKDIILRWMDIMLSAGTAPVKGRRYFYRPIAAAKTGHKGTVLKA